MRKIFPGRAKKMTRKIILAPDSFKGTMDASEVCSIQRDVILGLIPDAQLCCIPMADGGEGMTEAYLAALGGERRKAWVTGPKGQTLEVCYGLLSGGMAVMEMAAAAGLPLMEGRLDPLGATTRGVGEMILDAKSAGASHILLGLGGSATNDGGIGMAAALGYRFWDEAGGELEPYARNLGKICRITAPEEPLNLTVQAACDVDNPLCGPEGAVYTFGRQKGAGGELLELLDKGLENLARVIKKDLGKDVLLLPGSGAAGGLGAGVAAFLGGALKPGIELLLCAAGFDEQLEGADLVITGEGRMDWQSARGKVPWGVAQHARKKGVPCIALCGSLGPGAERLYEQGITAMFSALRGEADFERIKQTCREDLRLLTESVIRLLMQKGSL